MPKFPKKERLLSPKDFERVRRNGVFVSVDKIKFALLRSNKKRIGIIISSACGGAVTRNRFKRVIREHFRLNRSAYPEADIVIIAKPGIAKFCNDEIRGNLDKCLKVLSK